MTELHRRSSAGTGGSPPGISRSSTAGGGGGKGGLSQPAGCQSLLSFTILLLACVCGFSSRLFAVIRFESLIHEFDPCRSAGAFVCVCEYNDIILVSGGTDCVQSVHVLLAGRLSVKHRDTWTRSSDGARSDPQELENRQ
ncbi:Dolichyl-diphosphooligosaccharide--protein glycosyltransferase subunit STT3B [Anabarilius grahami]|uniref:Dolichyl-diphosphooligosaccharide--protein glycosyltransferase subunit STT3B n=1 Tax=Anabarilius grahami TaxID=495550 RepID=A0A3N0Z2R1_ANAGA|nr:Dolichyl-diphosphooligosaccharide--protein glycosyltransferase subunit STT3B [Anabarilius grahami]